MESPRPTRVRHGVVLASMLMAILLYLDRFCVSMAQPYISQDLGLSTFQMGLFFSAFFLSYALAQVPSGWLSDRFGSRQMLTIYILAWSLFTALMGAANSFLMLIIMRAAYGVGQAGGYPTSANIVSKWVPFSRRGMASSLIAFGGRFGGAIAPFLTAFLIVLLVPISQSSLLETEMILGEADICLALAEDEAEENPAVGRVREFLPESLLVLINEKVAEDTVKGWFQSLKLEMPPTTITEGQRQEFAAAMNSIIEDDSFYDPAVFTSLKSVERMAVKFMKRLKDGEQLDQRESQRLNRLLLESISADAIGKVYIGGWRPVMFIYGFAGIFVAGLFWYLVRNRPEEHPWCNDAERALIAEGRPADAPGPHGKAGNVPWKQILSSRSIWLSCIGQVGTNIGWIFIGTWFQLYLFMVHEVPILERGLMVTIPFMVGWLGMLGGGLLTDFLVPRVGLKWGRRIPWAFSRLIGVAAFCACPFADDPWTVTILLCLVTISTDLGTASGWAFYQDVGGKYVGCILGFCNMWGNLGAAIGPILMALIIGEGTDVSAWNIAFYVCAGSFVLSFFCALGVDASIPVAPTDEEDEQHDEQQGEQGG